MSEFEIAQDADELHEAARSRIMSMCVAPPGVKFPDGFRAGEGAWVTKERPIPKLQPFDESMKSLSTVWRSSMAIAWYQAGIAILVDFRVDTSGYLFRDMKMALREADRLYPGILEESGVNFCMRQSNLYEQSFGQGDFDAELSAWNFHGSEDTLFRAAKDQADALGFELSLPMFRFSQVDGYFYPQKSLGKAFHSRDGRIVKSAPWSWNDFSEYCEETVFPAVVAQKHGMTVMGDFFGADTDPEKTAERAMLEAAYHSVMPSWLSGVHQGQIHRVIVEMTKNSMDSVNAHYAARLVGLAALYSISRGGNRSMDRKIQKYLNGAMSPNRRR